jgi:hypothetical protein
LSKTETIYTSSSLRERERERERRKRKKERMIGADHGGSLCNHSYSGSKDQEDCRSRAAQIRSKQKPSQPTS